MLNINIIKLYIIVILYKTINNNLLKYFNFINIKILKLLVLLCLKIFNFLKQLRNM